MKIIISNASMVPIYEQIMDQIKSAIVKGDTSFEEALPSVRSLAKDLK
ncbi:MAG: GntR family transcriptional regulator, partial [Longicatena sp.]